MNADGDWLVETDWIRPCIRALRRIERDAVTVAADTHVELIIDLTASHVCGYVWRDSSGYERGGHFNVRAEGVGADETPSEEAFIQGTADLLLDELLDSPSAPWPRCKEHSNHSLVVHLLDEVAVWTCPMTGRAVAAVGSLAGT